MTELQKWEKLLEDIQELKKKTFSKEENKMTKKEMKAAIFEGTMLANGKGDIPYLDKEDIATLVRELDETPGGKLNLSPEAYQYYREAINNQREVLEEIRKKEAQAETNNFILQVEQDKEKTLEKAIEMDRRLPWQLRRNPAQIQQEIKRIVGQPGIGDITYRAKLANYLGGTIDDSFNRVEINENVLNQRAIQKQFETNQAEMKSGNNEGNK
jgi:hypothetical protein